MWLKYGPTYWWSRSSFLQETIEKIMMTSFPPLFTERKRKAGAVKKDLFKNIDRFICSRSEDSTTDRMGRHHWTGHVYHTHLHASSSSSSIEGHLSLKVIFHWRLSSIEACLPLMVIFHWRLSSVEGCLPSKVLVHLRSFSFGGHLSSKSFSIKGCLPLVKNKPSFCSGSCDEWHAKINFQKQNKTPLNVLAQPFKHPL